MKLLRNIFFTLITYTVATGLSYASDDPIQGSTIKGTIKDNKGDVIIGATIQVENTDIGTISNMDGSFLLKNIPVNQNLKIVISYIGYKPVVKRIETKAIIDLKDIILSEDVLGLDEVVVIGYTQTKRNSRTSAISTITSDYITSTVSTSFNEQIQGQAPGLIVSASS
ncbi:MAG: carboxypeptidase-like regulatory domain-containing protein [Parabacteroides sp.]|nr:carboxypeptidase-like regulatory domain-containing protein [Parabacteroides sp.]